MKHYQNVTSSVLHTLGAAIVRGLADGSLEADIDVSLPAIVEAAINTLKAEKIAQIDAAYNAAIQQDVTYMGFVFQADIASQDILSKTVSTLNGVGYAPPGSYWKEKGNTRVPMTLAELNGLAMAMWAQGQVAFSHKDDLKAQVAAATTDAEVAAVTW